MGAARMPGTAPPAAVAAIAAVLLCAAGAGAVFVRTTVDYGPSPLGPCNDNATITGINASFSETGGICLASDAQTFAGSQCSEAGGGTHARTFCAERPAVPANRGLLGWPFAESIAHLEASAASVEYAYRAGSAVCAAPGYALAALEAKIKSVRVAFTECEPTGPMKCQEGTAGEPDAVLSACGRFATHPLRIPDSAPVLRQQHPRLARRQGLCPADCSCFTYFTALLTETCQSASEVSCAPDCTFLGEEGTGRFRKCVYLIAGTCVQRGVSTTTRAIRQTTAAGKTTTGRKTTTKRKATTKRKTTTKRKRTTSKRRRTTTRGKTGVKL